MRKYSGGSTFTRTIAIVGTGMERTVLAWGLERFPDTPRKSAKEWILAGGVSVARTVVRKPNKMFADASILDLQDRRLATLALDEEWRIHPRLSLVYLEPSLAIVNKDAGLLSVPAPITDLSALSILADFLAGKLRGLVHRSAARRPPAAVPKLPPAPVHRLDPFTTGCLL